jgi:hypothetical protein
MSKSSSIDCPHFDDGSVLQVGQNARKRHARHLADATTIRRRAVLRTRSSVLFVLFAISKAKKLGQARQMVEI